MIPLLCCLITTNIPKKETKAKMVCLRFNSFLVIVMVLLHATNSGAQSHQAMERKLTNQIIEPGMQGSDKEIHDKVPAAIEVETASIHGRKMMVKSVVRKEMTKVEDVNGQEAKISGIDGVHCSTKQRAGNSQDQLKYQEASGILKTESVKSKSQSTSSAKGIVDLPAGTGKSISTKGNLERSSGPKEQAPQALGASFQDLQPHKLLEGSNEVDGLMNKDYPGDGGPCHKPPINNNEPLSHGRLIP